MEFSEVASAQGLIYNTYLSKVVRMRKMLRTQNIQQVVEKCVDHHLYLECTMACRNH